MATWDRMGEDLLTRLVNTMVHRGEAVIKAEG